MEASSAYPAGVTVAVGNEASGLFLPLTNPPPPPFLPHFPYTPHAAHAETHSNAEGASLTAQSAVLCRVTAKVVFSRTDTE